MAKFGWCIGPVGIEPPHSKCKKKFSINGKEVQCDCYCHKKVKK